MSNRKLFGWLLAFVNPLWGKMACAVLLGILSNLSVVAIPLLGTYQFLQLVNGNTQNTIIVFICMLLLGVFRGIARYSEQYLNHDIAFRLLATIRNRLYTKVRALGPARLTTRKSGDFITTITTDVEQLEVFFAHTVSPCFIAFGTTLVTVGFLACFDGLSAFILLIGQCLVGIVVPLLSYQRHQRVGDAYSHDFAALNQTVIENIESVTDINQFQLAKERLDKVKQQGLALNGLYKKRLDQSTSLQILSDCLFTLTACVILVTGMARGLPRETVTIATVLSLSSFGSVFALSGLGNALLTTLASGRRIYRFLQEKIIVSFPETPGELETVEQAVYTEVAFTYPESKKTILNNISLTACKGSCFGIGGESGVGKSTLIKLLLRYWDPDTGEVSLNDTPLPTLSEAQLHQAEGVMEQQTFLFHDTLWNNLLLGNPHGTKEEVDAAVKKASLTEWIDTLPKGYETIIGGTSRPVSDGERQRIGLARLFLQDAPLLLLDEPTSSLDYLNEQLILQSLKGALKDKTVLLVSHRQTTLALANRQALLQNGKLIFHDS